MGLALTAIAKGYRCIFTMADKQSQEKIYIVRSVVPTRDIGFMPGVNNLKGKGLHQRSGITTEFLTGPVLSTRFCQVTLPSETKSSLEI